MYTANRYGFAVDNSATRPDIPMRPPRRVSSPPAFNSIFLFEKYNPVTKDNRVEDLTSCQKGVAVQTVTVGEARSHVAIILVAISQLDKLEAPRIVHAQKNVPRVVSCAVDPIAPCQRLFRSK